MSCTAYTIKGHLCGLSVAGDYCKKHTNSLKMIGPMRFFQNQKIYPLKTESKRLRNEYIDSGGTKSEAWTNMLVVEAQIKGLESQFVEERRMGPHTEADHKSYINHVRKVNNRKILRKHERERNYYKHWVHSSRGVIEEVWIRNMRLRMIEEVAENRITYRDAYNQMQAAIDMYHRREDEMEIEENLDEARRNLDFADADDWEPPVEQHVQRTLAQIAGDNQSVHTTEVVNKTMDMIALIRNIEIPEEYGWNMTRVSKTMTEIISECELSPAAAWQFSSKYCAADTIYEMEEGIFGKLTDAMWQHVKKSTNSSDLKKIVKSELQDNIGMCAQGNLSRIANILVGYLDGLSMNEETRLDKIAAALLELRPKLMGIGREVDVRLEAIRVLSPIGMTADEMKPWIDALVDEIE